MLLFYFLDICSNYNFLLLESIVEYGDNALVREVELLGDPSSNFMIDAIDFLIYLS